MKLAEIRRAGYDYCEACWRFVEVRRVRFDCSNACCQLVEVWEVGFVYRKALMRLVGVRRALFDYRKACWSFSRMNEWMKFLGNGYFSTLKLKLERRVKTLFFLDVASTRAWLSKHKRHIHANNKFKDTN